MGWRWFWIPYFLGSSLLLGWKFSSPYAFHSSCYLFFQIIFFTSSTHSILDIILKWLKHNEPLQLRINYFYLSIILCGSLGTITPKNFMCGIIFFCIYFSRWMLHACTNLGRWTYCQQPLLSYLSIWMDSIIKVNPLILLMKWIFSIYVASLSNLCDHCESV